ncbi:TlpA disulfide reductase family protein [Flavobacterium sp. ALD4]|uniref:TlpA family protein disulfide reductase n=1 Tax=Flavobacterium sp. ALD4 TaxID=2058314 RepID=UPI001E366B58|nr:TlpA disulfide reductase family protein [Flavobacterium sp. ALD4]
MSVKFWTKYNRQIREANKLNFNLSPSFDCDNYYGGKTKLEDFKGKYVYIDVWATWCGPCLAEIPSLKKIEEKFHDRNIAFVSISNDKLEDIEK